MAGTLKQAPAAIFDISHHWYHSAMLHRSGFQSLEIERPTVNWHGGAM
jgi:hypothetical protein